MCARKATRSVSPLEFSAAPADPRWQEFRARITQHFHPRLDVPDAHAVVHDLTAVARRVPRRDITGADLQLKRRGHPVPNHQRVRFFLLSVLVQVDEARCYNETFGVDHSGAGERCFRYRLHATGADADIAHGVEFGLGIDDATVRDNEVVRLSSATGGKERRCNENDESH